MPRPVYDAVARAEENRRYYEANAERINAQRRSQYAAHDTEQRAKLLAKQAEYRRRVTTTTIRAKNSRQRARRRGALGSHTHKEWLAVLEAYGNCCAHCGTTERLERDHIVPIVLGGSDDAANLQPLCRSCNGRKDARTRAADGRSPVAIQGDREHMAVTNLSELERRLAALEAQLADPPHECKFAYLRSERITMKSAGEDAGDAAFGGGQGAYVWYDVSSCVGCNAYRYIRQPRIPDDFLGAKVFTLRPRLEVPTGQGGT